MGKKKLQLRSKSVFSPLETEVAIGSVSRKKTKKKKTENVSKTKREPANGS